MTFLKHSIFQHLSALLSIICKYRKQPIPNLIIKKYEGNLRSKFKFLYVSIYRCLFIDFE